MTADRSQQRRTPWYRWTWSQFASLAGKVGLLLSDLSAEGSLAMCLGGAAPAFWSSQCITRGVCKAQAVCCEKWSSLFVLTTPGWYIAPTVQLKMSKATHLTHVPSLSRMPFLKSYDIFQSIVIIPQCSGESAGKPTSFDHCSAPGEGCVFLGLARRAHRQRLESQNTASALAGF